MNSIRDEISDRIKKNEEKRKDTELKYKNERNEKIEECVRFICDSIRNQFSCERVWDNYYTKGFLGLKLHSGKPVIVSCSNKILFVESSDPFCLPRYSHNYDDNSDEILCNADDKQIIFERIAPFLREQNIKLVYTSQPEKAKKQYPRIHGYLSYSTKNIELAFHYRYNSPNVQHIAMALFLN